jgi:predicted RNase H-like HicB family nuclease
MSETEYVVVVREDEDGGYWTDVPSLPGTGSQGETFEEAIENTREAISLMIDYLKDKNVPVPAPKEHIVKVTVAS